MAPSSAPPGRLSEEAAQLRAALAQATRRRDQARLLAEKLQGEVAELQYLVAAREQEGSPGAKARLAKAGGQGLPEALSGADVEIVTPSDRRGRTEVRMPTGELRQVPTAALQVSEGAPPAGRCGAAVGAGAQPPPLLSTRSLLLRSCLNDTAASLPCELWPFIYSGMLRVEVPEVVLGRLRAQLDDAAERPFGAADESPSGGEFSMGSPDEGFVRILAEASSLLSWAFLGAASRSYEVEVEGVRGVVQRPGDFNPLRAQRCRGSHVGFSSLLDVQLPPSLSSDNHERPAKGAYGFHDGLHNFLWKGDRTTDRDDLVQPGIVQCELSVGFLYVFPQWLQHLTYPFEGPGERRWVRANVALRPSTTP